MTARKKTGRGARSAGVPNAVYEWDRRKDESPEEYQAFLVYRDIPQGQRSLRAVRERYGKGAGFERLLERWSPRYSWTFRVDAWDAHLQRLADRRIREIFTEQIERHRVIGDASLAAVSEALDLTISQLRRTDAEGKRIGEPPAFGSVIAAAATVVELQQKIAAQAVERLERAVAGGPIAGATEELKRRILAMGAAKGQARQALEQAQAPSEAVKALQEQGGGAAPAP